VRAILRVKPYGIARIMVCELSVAPAAIPEIKATLSALTLARCEAAAAAALRATGADEVRAISAR